MRMHLLLIIGAAAAVAVLTAGGFVGGPLATLLLIGLLLLCPLMMLGVHGGGRDNGRQRSGDDHGHAPAGSGLPRHGPRQGR
jgi:hypothetical protein